jgi:hypothetical protein
MAQAVLMTATNVSRWPGRYAGMVENMTKDLSGVKQQTLRLIKENGQRTK